MRIDDTKIISKISKEQGVNHHEAEKAIKMFYQLIGKEIAAGTDKTIEVKHLGKFIPKKPYSNGAGINHPRRRRTNVQPVC